MGDINASISNLSPVLWKKNNNIGLSLAFISDDLKVLSLFPEKYNVTVGMNCLEKMKFYSVFVTVGRAKIMGMFK